MVRRALIGVLLVALGLAGGGSALAGAPDAATSVAPPVAQAPPGSTIVITGHGWGHGMGMSQWGAYGYALHGWHADRILLHYYVGTTIGRDPAKAVHVQLADKKPGVTLGSAAPWRVVDGAGTRVRLPAGPLELKPSLELAGKKLVSPLTFKAGTAPVEVEGAAYRGSLVVYSNGATIEVVNTVGMESYLDGVVGEEVSPVWPEAALEAQAIAARSFAISQLDVAAASSTFDLYSDGRSEVYGGIAAEAPAVTAAVSATAGRVVLYDGTVATTYYSSSSGGETVSAAEAMGTAIPYLVSVADPWDTYSPYHDWGPVILSARDAGKALGLDGPLADLELTPGASGRITTATALTPGGRLTLTGDQVRDALGLRSNWFELAWLGLTPPAAPAVSGSPLTLTGVARGLLGVTLESRTPGGQWHAAGPVTPDGTGAFSVQVVPRGTTQYRLASGTVRAALVTVTVAGR